MSAITISLPDGIHRKVEELAQADGLTLDQFVSSAVGEKLDSVLTLGYLESKAAQGDKEKFKAILAKVPDRDPLSGDRFDD